MGKRGKLKFDEIGYWTEVKLDIILDYAKKYSAILAAQKKPVLEHFYIDAFSGAGMHISKTSREIVPGSPLNALSVEPPFRGYHFIDLNPQKAGFLKEIVGDQPSVYVYEGNCNEVLLSQVFPKVKYEHYRRGLCLLDPYGLHLDWRVIETAGKMDSIEIFLNFPVADMNRNVLWRNPEGVDVGDIQRMTAFWGDESWRDVAYTKQEPDLLGDVLFEKNPNEVIAEAFQQRLKKVAGFGYVPEPMPMRNTSGAIVYYLFFASQKPVAKGIVEYIFDKYRDRKGG